MLKAGLRSRIVDDLHRLEQKLSAHPGDTRLMERVERKREEVCNFVLAHVNSNNPTELIAVQKFLNLQTRKSIRNVLGVVKRRDQKR